MLDAFKALTPEYVATGLVGLAMIGVVARNVILGWYEAHSKIKTSEKDPFVSALSLSWDKDQIERFLQILENISESLEFTARSTEAVAKAQGILSDSFQQTTQSKLNELLDRLDRSEEREDSRAHVRRKT